jgi:hypothetical protein
MIKRYFALFLKNVPFRSIPVIGISEFGVTVPFPLLEFQSLALPFRYRSFGLKTFDTTNTYLRRSH